MTTPKALVVATSHKTRGGVTAVLQQYMTTSHWHDFQCKWIGTHIDKSMLHKLLYLFKGLATYLLYLPFYDIVHIHFSLPPSAKRKYIFFQLARLFHKKIVIHLHCGTQMDEIWSPVYYKMFTRADVCLVLSEVLKKKVEEYIGFRDNLKVLYNPCPNIERIEHTNKKKQILFAGTLYQGKGYSDLIKAFAKIAAKHPDWKIVFAGNGEVEQGKKLAQELNIKSQTEFLGWVNGDAKDKAFKESMIFCLPSYAEGFPMAVLDAWAYGLPVITTPVGGIPDIAADGKNMLLFNPGEIDVLATQIDRMISDEKLRHNVMKESIKLAATTFNIDTINKEVETIYKSLIPTSQTISI